MRRNRKKTSNALEILHRRYYEGKPERIAELEIERIEDEIGRQLLQIRENMGLTQQSLAKKVGTTASVISRMEDAGYQGHSIKMLRKIAAAVNKRVEVRFVSNTSKRKLQPA